MLERILQAIVVIFLFGRIIRGEYLSALLIVTILVGWYLVKGYREA